MKYTARVCMLYFSSRATDTTELPWRRTDRQTDSFSALYSRRSTQILKLYATKNDDKIAYNWTYLAFG